MANITSKGFEGKTLIQYKADIEQEYLNINSQWDISPESIDGESIAINSEMFANLDDQIGIAYSACDPDTASGQSLLNICAISDVQRKDGTFSVATVSLTGVAGTTVTAGSKVRHKTTGTLWVVTKQVVIPSKVIVRCETRGAETAGIGDLSIIATPIGGWQGVTNAAAADLGDDIESMDHLRIRRNESVAKPSRNQLDSIYGEVASLKGVLQIKRDENFTKTVDANKLDPNSIILIVSGGEDQEIADAMAIKKNPGCGLNKDNANFENQVVVDTKTPVTEYTASNGLVIETGGSPFQAVFFRPKLKSIYVTVNVKKTSTVGNLDLINRIKQYIIEYSNATLFSGESVNGFNKTGFSIGEDIAAGRLYVPVQKAVAEDGYTESIFVGDSSSPSGSNVVVGYQGLGTFSESEIVVNVS